MTKNIIICCDGTSNEFGKVNTNIVRLVQVLDQDPTKQLVYYGPGVGTMPRPGLVGRPAKFLSKVFGLAFGAGLVRNVVEAYAFLMDKWQPGDKVFLFGFSRGAYTVRVLAGMLYQMGLLRQGQGQLVPYAVRMYRAIPMEKHEFSKHTRLCNEFRQTFSRPIPGDKERRFPIHFIGVWDTVSSVGWVWSPKVFAHTRVIPTAKHIRHAISLDERRCFFRQNLFDPEQNADLVERWFSGSHCDIGGGYKKSVRWRVAFEWMLEQAIEAEILVDPHKLKSVRSTVRLNQSDWELPTEESLTPIWWLAEFFPKLVYHRELKGRRPGVGLGRSRVASGAILDESVLARIRNDSSYRPRNLPRDFRQAIINGQISGSLVAVPHGFRSSAEWWSYLLCAVLWSVTVGAFVMLVVFVCRHCFGLW